MVLNNHVCDRKITWPRPMFLKYKNTGPVRGRDQYTIESGEDLREKTNSSLSSLNWGLVVTRPTECSLTDVLFPFLNLEHLSPFGSGSTSVPCI